VARVKAKTEVATIKLTPQCRLAWEAAAVAETRSLTNMFEVAIMEYFRRHIVLVPDGVSQGTLTPVYRISSNQQVD
jgi:hypothetical protein